MPSNVSPRIDIRWVAATVVAFSVAVLISWEIKFWYLIYRMTPNTAACFLLCGISLYLAGKAEAWARSVATICACGALIFSAATLWEYLGHVSFGIDGLLLHHRMDLWYAPDLEPGRFARNTAIGFMVCSLSLIFLNLKRFYPGVQLFATLSFALGYLGVVGRLYHAAPLYSSWMSPVTASGFIVLGIAVLVSDPDHGISRVIMRNASGGYLARRLVLFILLLLPALGLLRIAVEKRGLADSGLITATAVLVNAALVVSSILVVAAALNTADEQRENAEVALRRGEKLAATGRFAATVAHEMNNPLAAVVNLLYLAQNSPEATPHLRSMLDAAQQELKRVTHISRQTLAFYKDNAVPEDFAITELMHDILFLMQTKIRNKNLVVETRCADCWIHGVKGEIRQIVANLMGNAIDASPDGGIIILRGGPCAENMVRIEIIDHGKGISSGDLKKLYQPFFTTKADVGNGLGLWVSKNLVEKNSGTITMTTSTDPGKSGTTFAVAFPAGASVSIHAAQARS